jgi:ankyrin repeat protein
MLLKLGDDVNAVNDAGETPVFGPAYTGADLILQELVDRGAAINTANKAGQTPLDIAEADTFASGAAIFHKSTAQLLRQLGARSGKAAAAPQ